MRQTGRVLSVDGNRAEISVIRQTACGDSCETCSSKCSLKDCRVVAEAVPGLKTGDTVIFEMAASKVLFAAFVVYITPLLALIAGYLISMLMGAGEGMCAAIGILSMVVWFVVVHFIDKKLSKYYKHTILEITEGEN